MLVDFFFFQAEDGIRDLTVTGVQTCALPIYRRFRNHLDHERPYLFTFLYCPGLDATNNVSERAIRALIGARKNWGGNRTPRGARAQAVLTSILQTAKQQGKKRSEEHTSELHSQSNLVCRLLLEK